MRVQFEKELSPRTFVMAAAERQVVSNQLAVLFFNEQPIVEEFQLAEAHLHDKTAMRLRDLGRDVSRIAIDNRDFQEGVPLISSGRLSDIDLSLNQIINRQLSWYGRYRYANSVEHSEFGDGPIAYTPKHLGVAGLTWVHPHGLYTFTQAVARSERCYNRLSFEAVCEFPIEGELSLSGGIAWELSSKRLSVEYTIGDLFSRYWEPHSAFTVKWRP